MILIALVRHGRAARPGNDGDDRSRRLTDAGKDEALRTGRYLAGRLPAELDILCSPKARARMTAEILAAELDAPAPVPFPRLEGGFDADAILSGIARTRSGALLLVGHEPDMGRLLARLLDPASRGSIPFPTAGCAIVSVDALPQRELGRLLAFGP